MCCTIVCLIVSINDYYTPTTICNYNIKQLVYLILISAIPFAESLANRFNRRKSVFAESYDPEGDDDEGEKVIM